MNYDTIGSSRATNSVRVIRADPNSIMTLSEAQKLERKQAEDSDYFTVYLHDDAVDRDVSVRTCCWVLDAERKPVLSADNKRTYRDPHDVALDVWAAYGADDHTLLFLKLGPVPLVNAESLALAITMSQQSRG